VELAADAGAVEEVFLPLLPADESEAALTKCLDGAAVNDP
jgi:hypothetical protein